MVQIICADKIENWFMRGEKEVLWVEVMLPDILPFDSLPLFDQMGEHSPNKPGLISFFRRLHTFMWGLVAEMRGH